MEKKMNGKWLPHIIAVVAFVVFIVLGLACASAPEVDPSASAVKFDSADTLKDYLNEQPDNSPDKPIAVAVPVNDQTLKDILDIINSSGRYVNFILSGNELTTIQANIFKNCANLTGITLPNSVTSIKDNAFNGCTNLTEINLGSNVAGISYTAFNNCPNLISIKVDSRNQNFTSGLYVQENGYARPLYNKDKTILIRCPEGYKGNFIVADSVRAIAPYCFYQTGITGVTLGGSVFNELKVYENAFINCTSLTSVTFTGGVVLAKGSFDGNLFEVWDKATTINFTNGTQGFDIGFSGRFTRPNGTSTEWRRTAGR